MPRRGKKATNSDLDGWSKIISGMSSSVKKERKDMIEVPIRQLTVMLCFAARYAYMRSTAAPSTVADWIMMYARHFDVDDLQLALRDVTDAQKERQRSPYPRLNHECDLKTLEDLKAWLENEIESRQSKNEINYQPSVKE